MSLMLTPAGQGLRAANDSVRPVSTIELALKLKPTGTQHVWKLDPQYDQWMRANYPGARFYFSPLELYDRMVRPADGPCTFEELDGELNAELRAQGGYTLEGHALPWGRKTMFAVGCRRPRALIEFLFKWS
jgi:hypothetical protein